MRTYNAIPVHFAQKRTDALFNNATHTACKEYAPIEEHTPHHTHDLTKVTCLDCILYFIVEGEMLAKPWIPLLHKYPDIVLNRVPLPVLSQLIAMNVFQTPSLKPVKGQLPL